MRVSHAKIWYKTISSRASTKPPRPRRASAYLRNRETPAAWMEEAGRRRRQGHGRQWISKALDFILSIYTRKSLKALGRTVVIWFFHLNLFSCCVESIESRVEQGRPMRKTEVMRWWVWLGLGNERYMRSRWKQRDWNSQQTECGHKRQRWTKEQGFWSVPQDTRWSHQHFAELTPFS